MTETSTLQFNRSVIGVEVPGEPFEITREQIRAFCEAVGDANPLFTDEETAATGPYGGVIAPPNLVILLPTPQPPDPEVQFGNVSIGGGKRVLYHAPIRPGDVITPSSAIVDVYEKTGRSGRMAFIVRRTSYVNQRGEQVAATEQVTIRRKVESAEDHIG
jgi:acyl dehydratase